MMDINELVQIFSQDNEKLNKLLLMLTDLQQNNEISPQTNAYMQAAAASNPDYAPMLAGIYGYGDTIRNNNNNLLRMFENVAQNKLAEDRYNKALLAKIKNYQNSRESQIAVAQAKHNMKMEELAKKAQNANDYTDRMSKLFTKNDKNVPIETQNIPEEVQNKPLIMLPNPNATVNTKNFNKNEENTIEDDILNAYL